MNRFEKSLDRIKKNVEIEGGWTDDDIEHYKTIIEALEMAKEQERLKPKYDEEIFKKILWNYTVPSMVK